MSDLIKREDAINAVEECLKLLARPRYTVKTAIEAIPSVDVDISEYSDKLWKNAYERGKADRPQGEWIPCSERLPEENGKSYLTFQYGDDIRFGWCQVLRYDDGWNCFKGDKENEIKCVVAWMPLPEPWKGADDEAMDVEKCMKGDRVDV